MSLPSLDEDPLDEVPIVTADRQDSKERVDTQDSIDLLHHINESWRYDARVASISEDHSDEYTIDIYEKGIAPFSDGTFPEPTRRGIKAHSMYYQESLQVGCVIKVRLLRDNTALILPPEMPTGQGFGKVAMLIDDTSGVAVFDYPRFAVR